MPTVRRADVPPDVWAQLTGAEPAAVKRKRPTPKPAVPFGFALAFTLPCVVVSEANRRDHWAARRRRFKSQVDAFHRAIWSLRLELHGPDLVRPELRPVVTLTRLGGKALDTDNLAGAFKGLRDAVAAWLGVDDGDARVSWRYGQEPGGSVGVRVELEACGEGSK